MSSRQSTKRRKTMVQNGAIGQSQSGKSTALVGNRTSFLQTEIKLSTTSYLEESFPENSGKEDHRRLKRMFFKLLRLATGSQSWLEKDEELLNDVNKITRQGGSREAFVSSKSKSESGIRIENTGSIKTDSEGEKTRIKEITALLKIPYELNKMTLVGTAVSSNNVRILRFFCKVLKTYDEVVDSKDSEESALYACLNKANDMGNTPLMIAAEHGHVDTINELIRLGADMMRTNQYGMNCLHLAVERNRVEAVKVLLDHATTHLEIDTSESFTKDDQDFKKADDKEKHPEKDWDVVVEKGVNRPDADKDTIRRNKDAKKRHNDCFWMVDADSLQPKHRKFLRLVQRIDDLKADYIDADIENKEYDVDAHHKTRDEIYREIVNHGRLKLDDFDLDDIARSERRCIWTDGINYTYLYQPKISVVVKDDPKYKEYKEKWVKNLKDYAKDSEEKGKGPLWFFGSELDMLYRTGKEAKQGIVEAYSEKLDHDKIYADESKMNLLKCEPEGILSRECRKEGTRYKVAWKDKSLIATWHSESCIKEWRFEDNSKKGEAMINDFNRQGDNIIRVFLNSRNKYGKSPFISTLEFDRPEIFKYFIMARHSDEQPSPWLLQKDDQFEDERGEKVSLMRHNLMESRNGKGATTLHFAMSQSNDLVKYFIDCYLGPIDRSPSKGSSDSKDKSEKLKINLIKSLVTLIETRTKDHSGTPLSWVCGVNTQAGCDNALCILNVLDRDDAKGSSAQSFLNRHSDNPNVQPNHSNNYLMKAARAGNFQLCKLFIEKQANNEKGNYKSAAEYAFDAKYYDVGYLLDKDLLRMKLQNEFVRRVNASVEVEYLSDLDDLRDTLIEGKNDLLKNMLEAKANHLSELYLVGKDQDQDQEVVNILIKAYQGGEGGEQDRHMCHPNFKLTEFVNSNELHSVDNHFYEGAEHFVDGDEHINNLPISDVLFLEEIKELRSIDDSYFNKNTYINEICDAYDGKTKGVQESVYLSDVLFHEPRKLYWLTPPGDKDGCRYLVKKLGQDKKLSDVRQHAMDHYMARIDLFKRVSRLAAIDDGTFDAFCAIVEVATIKDPTRFVSEVLKSFHEGLRDEMSVPHQKILLKLVLLCDALHCAMKNCLLTNKSVFEDEISKIKDSIRQLFKCRQMLDPETVKTVLMPIPSVRSYLNPTVTNARAFYMDVINKALKLELAGLFGTEQISGYIDRIFRGNLRSNDIPRDYRTSMDILSPFDVIKKQVNHRSTMAYEHLRYNPYAMFLLEAVSKLIFLGMVYYVSTFKMGEIHRPPHGDEYHPYSWAWYDIILGILLGATVLREIGEFMGNTADAPVRDSRRSDSIILRFFEEFYDHFLDGFWNFLDLLGIVCVGTWVILKWNQTGATEARAFLSVAAIPMSLGILRYASVNRDLGNLVITFISMGKDIISFLVVLVVALFGFVTTMRALFQHDHLEMEDVSWTSGFSTFYSTMISLMDAVLGNFSWDYFDITSPYFVLGIFLQLFLILVFMVVLFNLLIAKMTTTYEQKEAASLEDWEFTKAEIVKQYMLIGECSPLSMLPVPLNLITFALWPFHAALINATFYGNPLGYGLFEAETGENTPKRVMNRNKLRQHSLEMNERSEMSQISLAGTASDWILGVITAPLVSTYEITMDILQILVNTSAYYEKLQVKLAEKSQRAPILNMFLASAIIIVLVTLHTSMHAIGSPLLFCWYIYQHLHATITEPVYLEFMEATGPQLQIKYREDPTRKFKPKKNLDSKCFTARIIRGEIWRKGKPFADRPTRVQISAGPYRAETSAAVLQTTSNLAWENLPSNKKTIESFPQNTLILPTFPLGGDDLMRHIKISMITSHADGDLISASTHIHASQLHRWIYNGRFEGDLELVSHLEIPLHHHSIGKLNEVVHIEGPGRAGDQGIHQPCRCTIERDAAGDVLGIRYFPGFGYEETGESGGEEQRTYRVYHLLYTDWKNNGRVNFSSKGRSERIFSYNERSFGSDPDIFFKNTNYMTGKKDAEIKYIAKHKKSNVGEDMNMMNEDQMMEDLNYLRDLITNKKLEAEYLGVGGERRRAITLNDFGGKDCAYDTISMVTFSLDCKRVFSSVDADDGDKYGKAKNGYVVPVLKSPSSPAKITVAFYFDVDMSTHLNLASRFQLESDQEIDEQDKGYFTEKFKKLQNYSRTTKVHSEGSEGGSDLSVEEKLWSNLVKEDQRQEFDGHSRFDDTWTEHLESPLLYDKEELKTVFSFFIDGSSEDD